MKINYHQAEFIISAAELRQLPSDQGIEVAFAGRSNAGKSSALNTLTNSKNLAKTSKTPGRTQLINLFRLDDDRRLVDLPGYGYAKVPLEVMQRWQKTLAKYLETRNCLRGLILLMDIRHPLKEFDMNILNWASSSSLCVHILLTKADKLSRSAAVKTLNDVAATLASDSSLISVQIFSSTKKIGVDVLKAKLDQWFQSSSD